MFGARFKLDKHIGHFSSQIGGNMPHDSSNFFMMFEASKTQPNQHGTTRPFSDQSVRPYVGP